MRSTAKSVLGAVHTSVSHIALIVLIAGWAVTGKHDQSPDPDAMVKQALQSRDRPGATTREIKWATAVLQEAAGLENSKHVDSQSKAVPVPGFPDWVFMTDGSPTALRELAKAHQRGKGVDVNHKLSLELFRRAAELGDAEAQGAVAMRMAFGLHNSNSFEGASIRHFGRPDEAGALLHYYFGAANGDAFSRAALGYRHTFGLGVPKSCWTAVSYYQPVAEAVVQAAVDAAKSGPMGSSSGQGLPQIERIRLNVHANQGIKPDRQREVLQYYQYSADRGNIDAQTAVGTLLNFGLHGVNRDHVAAAHYLQRAAAAGNDEAMAHLGHMYGSGMGVQRDHAKALKYFRQAAEKQNPLGLYGLGYMYLSGKGVEQDYDLAYKHFQSAAEQGDRDAHFYLGTMYAHGLGMKRRSLNKAFLHYFQAAQAGHIQAMYNTAVMHLSGKGTPKSCKPALSNLKALVEKGPLAAALQAGHEAFFRGQHSQALLLYLQASELGMEIAQSNAAWMLDRGFAHAGSQAAVVATALFKRSAEQGNVMSLLQLGDCYYYGSGVEQDWVRASAIYYEAYKERSAEAMFNLGYMHEFGAGVPKDMDLAKRFYDMAKHTHADAALPVYLANAWLKLHLTWDWLRPKLPPSLQPVATLINWLFELRPVPGSPAARAVAAAGSRTISEEGEPDELAAAAAAAGMAPALPPAPAAATAPAPSAKAPSSSSSHDEDIDQVEAEQTRSWLWWLSPQLLVWQWDGLVWRIAEATGLGGLSVSALIEEYSDVGETLLLLVLMGVLLIVLRIRRQRQQALENQVLLALRQPGAPEEQQLAQQIAAQIGLQIPAAQAAVAGVRGSGSTPAVAAAIGNAAAQTAGNPTAPAVGNDAEAVAPADITQSGVAPSSSSNESNVGGSVDNGTQSGSSSAEDRRGDDVRSGSSSVESSDVPAGTVNRS